ncbi:MAG TPA: protein-L-isoaspartate(D-aspartate) O-methyltransferase [Candidatus Acidoferrales bacterium]|nr:protein-L-isoaspartate(D-aspartate) O-methyltransferase [Candidatus Acidoferrales bacterium]
MTDEPFAAERRAMVEEQLRRRGIHDERLLEAMRRIPRHEFVSAEQSRQAYADHPVVIPEQQTTSQPYIIAAMVQAAEVQPRDRVLEVGAGSGYQTALLAELAAHVIAVERYSSLAESAQARLQRLGYRNVVVVAGDGTLGWESSAPYDAIIVSAAAPRVPPALLEQLSAGGRLVIPIGDAHAQVLQLFHKNADDSISMTQLEACRFVPLIGRYGFAA